MGTCSLPGKFNQFGVSSCAARASKDRDLFRSVKKVRESIDFVTRRTNCRPWFRKMEPCCSLDGVSQGHITGQGNHRHSAPGEGGLHSDLEHPGHLFGMRHELAVMAALCKEVLRMRLLTVPTPDLGTRNLGGDRQHGNTAAMTIVEPINQMQVTRSTAAGTHGQPAGQMCLGAGGKGRALFVPDTYPADVVSLANRIGNSV